MQQYLPLAGGPDVKFSKEDSKTDAASMYKWLKEPCLTETRSFLIKYQSWGWTYSKKKNQMNPKVEKCALKSRIYLRGSIADLSWQDTALDILGLLH